MYCAKCKASGHRVFECTSTSEYRSFPSGYDSETAKRAFKGMNNTKTENGRNQARENLIYYIDRYRNLDQYDPRRPENKMSTTEKTTNYIEIKHNGITFKKQGSKLLIGLQTQIDYSDANVTKFLSDLNGGLEIVKVAAKLEPTVVSSPKGVEI